MVPVGLVASRDPIVWGLPPTPGSGFLGFHPGIWISGFSAINNQFPLQGPKRRLRLHKIVWNCDQPQEFGIPVYPFRTLTFFGVNPIGVYGLFSLIACLGSKNLNFQIGEHLL